MTYTQTYTCRHEVDIKKLCPKYRDTKDKSKFICPAKKIYCKDSAPGRINWDIGYKRGV